MARCTNLSTDVLVEVLHELDVVRVDSTAHRCVLITDVFVVVIALLLGGQVVCDLVRFERRGAELQGVRLVGDLRRII